MKLYKRILCLSLVVVFLHDVLSTRKVESMAVVAPVMQQVVLSAQTVLALASATAYVAKVYIDKWYQQPTQQRQLTQATPTYAPTNNSNITNSSAHQTAPKTYTFKHFAIHDLVAQAMQQQLGAPLSPEQKKVVHSVVANPFKAGIAPITQVRLNTSPYHDMHAGRIITGQDFVRWEYGNEKQHLYGQISFNHHPHMRGPTQQELEEYRLLYRYEHNPEYRQQIDAQREHEIRILIQAAIDCATFGKIAALKTFFATTGLQAPFDYEIKQIRYWLAPLFFDHTTGELVAKPKSIVEALRPIVEYFKNQYGDQWHHELGKYIDMQQFHLLVDAADYKGWYWAVNKIYSWFYSTFYLQWLNLAKKVVGNTTNQKIMASIEACQMQDFQAAKAIAQDAQSSVADEIYAYFYNQKFDAYGIRREFANDPAWAQLSEQTKQEIKNLPNGITFYNNFLALRAQEKTRQEIAEEQKNRPCGTGSIKEEEIQKPTCVVDVQEFEQKGACVQGDAHEIPDRPACGVTNEQEPAKTCNYGTQTQPSLRDPEVGQQEDSTVDAEQSDQKTENQKFSPGGEVKIYLPEEIIELLPSPEEIESLKEKIVLHLPEAYGGHEIEIDLEHILGIDYNPEKDEVSGLHHDPGEAIAKSGIITIEKIPQIECQEGFYAGWIIYNGKKKFSTFFPSEWSRAKILEEIVKAWKDVVENNKKMELNQYQNYEVSGNGSLCEINFVLDNSLKKIKTCYPIFSD